MTTAAYFAAACFFWAAAFVDFRTMRHPALRPIHPLFGLTGKLARWGFGGLAIYAFFRFALLPAFGIIFGAWIGGTAIIGLLFRQEEPWLVYALTLLGGICGLVALLA